MQRTSTWKALAILGVTALSVSACAKANNASTDNPSSTPAGPALPAVGWTQVPYSSVQSGGTLNLAAGESPTDVGNWIYVTSEGANVDAGDVEAPASCSPIKLNADGSWVPDPNYATSIKLVSTNPQVVEVKLNPKAVWQDGSPITANDYKATFAALSGKNKAYDIASSAGYDDVKSFDVVSPTDFKLTFTTPYADWPGLLGTGSVYPASIASNPQTWNKGYTNKPTPSCGPYVFSKIDNNAEVFTLNPNPRWWGEKPKLKTITFKVLDQATQAQAFVNGEINAVEVDQDGDSYDAAKKAPNALVERSGGLEWTQDTLNATKPGLNDVKVRKAIAMSINRVLMAHEANSPVGAAPETQGSYIFMPGQKGYVDTIDKYLPYSPSKAQALLKSDGYTLTNNKWTKNGQTLSFSIVVPAGTDTNIERAKQIQASLAQVHIPIQLQTVPIAQYFTKIEGGDYEMATFSWQGTAFPISSDESLFYPAGKPNTGQNYSFVTDNRLGPLWKKANQELNPTKRNKMANQLDAIIAQFAPMVPIAPTPMVFVMNKNLVNYGPAQFKSIDWTTVGFSKSK